MLIGVNWTSPSALPVIQSLIGDSRVSFCEILLDNFIHLDPADIRRAIGETPLSFHIMWSRFLERDESELRALAKILRLWIDEIGPLYVSDHLARFSIDGRTLPITAEIDYGDFSRTLERLVYWQELLGVQLLIENFPSARYNGHDQAAFYTQLLEAANCGLLFDISNAIVAKRNCGAEPNTWLDLIDASTHFHIAGFRQSDTQPALTIDSHDANLAKDSLALLADILERPGVDTQNTLVIERDANIGYQEWTNDIDSVYAAQQG